MLDRIRLVNTKKPESIQGINPEVTRTMFIDDWTVTNAQIRCVIRESFPHEAKKSAKEAYARTQEIQVFAARTGLSELRFDERWHIPTVPINALLQAESVPIEEGCAGRFPESPIITGLHSSVNAPFANMIHKIIEVKPYLAGVVRSYGLEPAYRIDRYLGLSQDDDSLKLGTSYRH
jgi:hypothetical protein